MRWLAIPAALLVLLLASLAIDTESRQGFIDRVKIEQVQQEKFEDVDATRLFFETADGEVVEFSLNDGEVLGRDSDGDIETMVFEPDPDGNVAGMVVNDDGTFSPFAPGDDVSGETILVPTADGGFILIQPDGSTTQIQVGENGIRAVDGNGNDLNLERDSDGRVDLGDGLSARDTDIEFVEGEQRDGDQALAEDSDSDSNGSSWIPSGQNLIIILIALLAIAGTVWWFVAMKPKFHLREGPVLAPVEVAGHRPATTWEAFEAYLAELLANPDPTQAIRQVYAYAEQGMGQLIPRHSEQTPFEWCDSVATTDPELAAILRTLSNRYSAIRFGDRTATSEQRDQAVAELRSLVQKALQ